MSPKRIAIGWMLLAYMVAVIFLAGATIQSCAPRVPASPTVPGRAATPIENLLAYNAALANANVAAEQGIIAANRAGLLPDKGTQDALDQSAKIAIADKQLTIIFQAGPAAIKGNSLVLTLIKQIQDSVGVLFTSGVVGVKDPQKQAQIKAFTDSILTIAGQISGTLQSNGLL